MKLVEKETAYIILWLFHTGDDATLVPERAYTYEYNTYPYVEEDVDPHGHKIWVEDHDAARKVADEEISKIDTHHRPFVIMWEHDGITEQLGMGGFWS